ncbi:EAL domain-containing protein [Calidifontibacillus oryziterrae]|uniref:EAL domain-containing protein n=1 Tax=Calidifontibacillus oryziterrae TaxID=1191699 RepID=UPI00031069BA|nr:EAL domain-containing protein [Calidifontibacillus oryziterrae]
MKGCPKRASLSYLSTYDIDFIKIDSSFIKEIGKNKRKESIISSLISLASVMNVKIVAEGVETVQQLQFLRDRNCHLIQGFLYSRPVNVNLFEKFLDQPFIKIDNSSSTRQALRTERRKHYRMNFPKPIIAEMFQEQN